MKASKSPLRETEVIPTGLTKLDQILDGGIRTRRMTQFSGESGAGKSTISLMLVGNAQDMGMEVLWLDTEHRFQFERADEFGVDLNKVELDDTQHAEALFDLAEDWARKKKRTLIVLDSIGGLLTRREKERSNDEQGFPDAPKLIPAFLRRVMADIALNQHALVLLNHEKKTFEGAIKILGGDAIKYHSDQWVRLRKITTKQVKQGDKVIGDVIEARIRKGKYVHETTELYLLSGKGFSKEQSLVEDAIAAGVLTKDGQSYVFNGEKVARGMAALREWAKDNTELLKEALPV